MDLRRMNMKLNGLILTMNNGTKFNFTGGSQDIITKSINDDGTFKYKALNINDGVSGLTARVIFTDNVSDIEYDWSE